MNNFPYPVIFFPRIVLKKGNIWTKSRDSGTFDDVSERVGIMKFKIDVNTKYELKPNIKLRTLRQRH